jgi:hypothetical protein
LVSALMLVMMAAPAFAFHHVFIPAAACEESPNAGGVAPAVGEHNPVFEPPLPPVGTAAVEHSDRITDPDSGFATCPADTE